MNKYNSYWKSKCVEMEVIHRQQNKSAFWDGFRFGVSVGVIVTYLFLFIFGN